MLISGLFLICSYFNPRSLAGATGKMVQVGVLPCISIHAPLRERQQHEWYDNRHVCYFNPRSLAGATHRFRWGLAGATISIHAPLRERLTGSVGDLPELQFQSTLPCGSDSIFHSRRQAHLHFNPRSLAGATSVCPSRLSPFVISIHAPLRERQHDVFQEFKEAMISIHAPLRERRIWAEEATELTEISIHAPLRERRRP